MRTHGVVAVVAALLCLAACSPGADAPEDELAVESGSALEGAWRVVEVREADSLTLNDPPSLYLFSGTHYSIMRLTGQTPRPTFAALDPTDAEKITAYDTFIANAGTYELVGDTLMIAPIVSKHPNYMGGGQDRMYFRLAGDTLWLTSSSGNLRFLINGQLVGPADSATTTTFRLLRAE